MDSYKFFFGDFKHVGPNIGIIRKFLDRRVLSIVVPIVYCWFRVFLSFLFLFNFFFNFYPSLIMVNKQHKNRFLAARFIFEKNFPVMYFCSGCKTANPNHPEKLCIVAPNNDVCSRYIRFGRHCDLFISKSVC